MFPAGLPGLALLLLRASVAVALLFASYGHRGAVPGWIQAAVIALSLALFAGFQTPIAAAFALAFHMAIGFGLGVDNVAATAVFGLDALALALLGPGAYSIDSHRFGRRLVVLPPP
jgi:hypothetical protein